MPTKWDPSKWELHKLYSAHPGIVKRLPPTSILTPDTLSAYLRKYDAIYVKGIAQHTGSGIIKAWKTKEGYRFVKVKGTPVEERSVDALYDKIKDGRRANSIVVQKAIDLATIDGRPYSIRLMLMRDGERKWQYAGMLAKVSGEDSVISNIRRGGGYAATIENALARSLGYDRDRIKKTKRELIRVGYEIIDHAVKNGYESHEAGLDMGIDKKGGIWIIEVNLAYPSYALFNRLENKKYYNKIIGLSAAYQKSVKKQKKSPPAANDKKKTRRSHRAGRVLFLCPCYSLTIRFVSRPSFSISIVTTSPSFKYTCFSGG